MTPPAGGRPPRIAGLLLAAGSGQRFGGPKALADTGDGPWVLRALSTLDGLDPRMVVVGAAADQVVALLPEDVPAVHNPDFDSGMGSSLVAGLRALDPRDVDAVVVMLVDLPDVPAAAIQRVIRSAIRSARQTADAGGVARPVLGGALVRAAYRGVPGHPVLIGAGHFAGVIESAGGDRGARDYLGTHETRLVECGDLARGVDVDTAPGHGGKT